MNDLAVSDLSIGNRASNDGLVHQYTFYNQRPVLAALQFQANSNVAVAPQDPDSGSLHGISFSGWRSGFKDLLWEERFDRNWAIEKIIEAHQGGLLSQGLSLGKAQELLDEMKKTLFRSDDESLRKELLPLLRQAVTDIDTAAIPKPTAEFQRLFSLGLIKPPYIDLSKFNSPDDGEALMLAIKLQLPLTGLPTLPRAFGISDVLAAENGSKGNYSPLNHNLLDENIDYGSRSSISTVSRVAFNRISKQAIFVREPYIPANMRCVSDSVSAQYGIHAGLCPTISYTKDNAKQRIDAAETFGNKVFITVRSGTGECKVAHEILRRGGNVCLEMANANMPRTVKVVRELKAEFPGSFIMVGNVGSAAGYWLAVEAGADLVKLGRGPGAGCTTPEETGISPGQVTLLYECAMVQQYLLMFRGLDVPMCLDGGLSTPGHCVVGAILGAETFMMGSKFAVAKEAPSEVYNTAKGDRYRLYFGEASQEAARLDSEAAGQKGGNRTTKPQGIVGYLPEGGTTLEIVQGLTGGLKGGIADLGVTSLGELIGLSENIASRLKTEGSSRETKTRLAHFDANSLRLENAGRYRV